MQKTKQAQLICGSCGKPVSTSARSNVTRFLFRESRCTCAITADESQTPALAIKDSIEESPAELFKSLSEEVRTEITKILGDKYDVLSLIGSGGMGAVYLVYDKVLDRKFAIKLLNSNLAKDNEAVARFKQEAESARHLSHPNLVAVYDYGIGTNGAPYIIMDFVDGISLAERIRKHGPLPIPQALEMFMQLSEAVNYAHSQGVVHRDIKPANIIITQRSDNVDVLKLIDFGIAKLLQSESGMTQGLTQTGEILGSPLYMSPEQCQGQKLDKRTDIYAIGCVMYESLAGRPPFEGINPIQTILKQINEQPAPVSTFRRSYDLPQDLEHTIQHCLQKDPSDRYQAAGELLSDLQKIQEQKKIKFKRRKKSFKHIVTTHVKTLDGVVIIVASVTILFFIAKTLIHSTAGIYDHPLIPVPQSPGNSLRDPYKDAERLDQLSYHYFVTGDYERAIPLLEFGIKTYKQNGSKLGKGGEDAYLADNYQHIGKCYLMLKKYKQAAPYYRDALKIYKKFGNYQGGMMPEAITDYATVLRELGKADVAQAMEDEFKQTKNIKRIP